MDPQIKGLLIGGISSAAAFTLGYLLTKGGNTTHHEPVPKQSSQLLSQYDAGDADEVRTQTGVLQQQQRVFARSPTILFGDVGGTNVRLILKRIDLTNPEDPGEVIKDGETHS